MKFFSNATYEASSELADEKGVFPTYEQSIYKNDRKLRNCSLIAIAPTGSRSILVETSPGIEPNFALGYTRKVMGSHEILQLNSVIENLLKEHDIYSEENVRKIINSGLNEIDLPDELKKVFVTAHNISPDWHVKIQAIFQKYTDNAISKTINFPRSATIEDIKRAFILAYDLGCRGLTAYREGSLNDQVITLGG